MPRPTMPRPAALALLALFSAGALAGCAGDPRDAGITGPYPDGVQANTLTQAKAKSDLDNDVGASGGNTLSSSQYVPLLRPKSSAGVTGGRYFGYNY